MKFHRVSIALVVACFATGMNGCTSYQARPIEPAATADQFMARSLEDARLQTYLREHDVPPSRIGWGLNALTWVALFYQPELDVARSKWNIAKAAAITAGARPNPTLDITNQYNVDATTGVSPWTLGPTLALPLETAGKRHARILEAQHRAEAARLELADEAWKVRSQVRNALLRLYPTTSLIEEAQRDEAQLVDVLEHRFREGEASRLDLLQAQLALHQFTLDTQESRKQRAEYRAGLATALGLPAQALDDAPISFDAFKVLPPADAIPIRKARRWALLNRPDVRRALADYRATEAALQGDVAKQYPDVTLGPGVEWDAGQMKWGLGLSLTLPIFNRNQGPIAEARARREEAAAQFFAVQARAIGEIDQTLAGYQQVVAKLATANALLADQRKAATSAQAFYDAGQTDSVDLLTARVELAKAQLDQARTLIEAQEALGALEDALRHPLVGAALNTDVIEHTPRPKDAM